MKLVACVAAGGAVGAVARYGLGTAAVAVLGQARGHWGTLAINVLGCFLAGMLVASLGRLFVEPALPRAFLLVGLMGGFTTFSAFGVETLGLMHAGDWRAAMLYVGASVLLGLAGAATGMVFAARLSPP